MSTRQCPHCHIDFYIGLRSCPHCAQPSFFPNVDLAESDVEKSALELRYEMQRKEAESVGKVSSIDHVMDVVKKSTACKGMPRWELDRLISSETATAATYYQQISGNCRIPDDNEWDRLRRITDSAFFQCYGHEINFAALSTNRNWLNNYGDGAIFFREKMIAHRSTVFEKNTVTWLNQRSGELKIPAGYRATWQNRGILAVAKLGDASYAPKADIDTLLLSCGPSTADDVFIEVHICGGFTIRSAEAVVVRKGALGALGMAAALERARTLPFDFTEIP